MVLGVAGVSSQSLSIDGLSQSIGTTASATLAAYSARLIQYKKDIDSAVGRLKLVYDEVKFRVF